MTTEEQPWPNKVEIVDGVIPSVDVPQDPDLFVNDPDDIVEMQEESND